MRVWIAHSGGSSVIRPILAVFKANSKPKLHQIKDLSAKKRPARFLCSGQQPNTEQEYLILS